MSHKRAWCEDGEANLNHSASTVGSSMSYVEDHHQHDLSELPNLRERVRGYVEEAIRQMHPDKKAAYTEAITVSPWLFSTGSESDPILFVRCCNYDVWAGAERLVAYWEERKRCFRERAFLPLILTGDGALTKEDANTLHAGFPILLPCSKSGQDVIMFDRRNWLPNVTIETKLRCMFYISKLVAENQLSQVDGTILLVLLVPTRLFEASHEYHIRSTYLAKVLPLKFKCHVAAVPNDKKPHLLQGMFGTMISVFTKRAISTEIHVERYRGQLVRELEQKVGLRPEGIPACIGGMWKIEHFNQWLRQEQLPKEKQRYKQLAKASQGPTRQTEEERKEKRRMIDLIQSRRKRARKQLVMDSLQKESTRLQEENNVLKCEMSRLENLLRQAEEIVAP